MAALPTSPLWVQMMRIDVAMFEQGLASSRTDAKRLICEGLVTVDGKRVDKPSYDVSESAIITVAEVEHRYVSRGGLKLRGAIENFKIEASGRYALDIGASSGGFTDCLLQSGAAHVIAIDSGYGQLVSSLRFDKRVTVVENYNARYMKRDDLEYTPDLVVMDVSFISATCIIPAIYEVAKDGADFICLVKPQFEVGRAGIGKGGIVKEERLRKSALDKVIEFAKAVGFDYIDSCFSPIKGGDGNIEYLVHFIVRKE